MPDFKLALAAPLHASLASRLSETEYVPSRGAANLNQTAQFSFPVHTGRLGASACPFDLLQ